MSAQTASQYESSEGQAPGPGGDSPSQGGASPPQERVAAEGPPVAIAEAPDPAFVSEGVPSQGSVIEGPGLPEENFPAYSQVVDNGSPGRFEAQGWRTASSSPGSYGKDYAASGAGKGTKPAQFRVKVPATDRYSVYAWWPAGHNDDVVARYGVRTTSGVRWTEVDQRRDGGFWVKLGEYEMARGDGYAVQVAPGSERRGGTIADAVAVVRGVQSPPPAAPGENAGRSSDGDGERVTATRAGSGLTGAGVVRQARSHLGDRYKYATCTTTLKSCTCLTKMSVYPFGHRMPMTENGQWTYARSFRVGKADLLPGDEVFFKETGFSGPITHVGIYSGGGNIVHASSYFGKVVESKMRYIKGFYGAKRFSRR